MKRLFYLLIPILLMLVIVIVLLKLLVFQDLGKGALQVTSKPFSKVYLNGKYIGTTPLCRCDAATMIESGDYTIKLAPVDNTSTVFQDKITITKGVLTVVDRKFGKGATSEGSIVSLQPITNQKSPELLVVTFPDNADVFVDANYQGKSPLHLNSVTDSDHALRIKKEGYTDKSVRIHTPAGYKLVSVIYLGLQNDTTTNPTPTPLASPSGTISVTPVRITTKQQKVTILQTPNGFLRVRQDASLTAPEIGRVSPGEIYIMTAENNGWYNITLKDGTTGWISSQYAQKQ